MNPMKKHGSHDQQSHAGGRGRFHPESGQHPAHGGGAKAVFDALPKTLDSINNKVSAEIKGAPDMGIADDLARAKQHLWSASRAEGPKSAANAIINAALAVRQASKRLSRKSLPKSIRVSDIGEELQGLYLGLMQPAGG